MILFLNQFRILINVSYDNFMFLFYHIFSTISSSSTKSVLPCTSKCCIKSKLKLIIKHNTWLMMEFSYFASLYNIPIKNLNSIFIKCSRRLHKIYIYSWVPYYLIVFIYYHISWIKIYIIKHFFIIKIPSSEFYWSHLI